MRFGPYEAGEELGHGAAGVVYRARSPDGRAVAIKVLRSFVSEDALARFEREVRLLRELGEESGFVPVLDTGAAPRPYLVTPLLTGGTLRDRLGRGPLDVGDARALVTALARALAVAHERGIVHRDLKAENILFDDRGRPLVADLGIAKHFRSAGESASLSAHGDFRGTLGSMAPEQARDAKSVGPPADVFSLGAILHECLAGAPPFQGDNVIEILDAVASDRRASVRALRPEVPAWLERVVERALASNPWDRFPDAAALALALEDGDPTPPPARPPRALVVGSLLALALLGAGVAMAVTARIRRSEAERQAIEAGARRSESARLALEARAALAGSRIPTAPELERALALDPGNALAWSNRAEARALGGDLEGALADCARAIELAPDDRRLARAWGLRGTLRARRKEWTLAVADSTRAIELEPGNPVAWLTRAVARRGLAGWLVSKPEVTAIISDCDRSLELGPGNAQAWATRGWAHLEASDSRAAIEDLDKAIQLAPTLLPHAWADRAEAWLATRDADRAISDATRAIELGSMEASTWNCRATAHLMKGNLPAAVADATKAIELDPKYAPPWATRGLARNKARDFEGAVPDLERFLELFPGNPSAPDLRLTLARAREEAAKARRGTPAR